jgi:hypothetical protein
MGNVRETQIENYGRFYADLHEECYPTINKIKSYQFKLSVKDN